MVHFKKWKKKKKEREREKNKLNTAARLGVVLTCISVQSNQVFLVVMCTLISIMLTLKRMRRSTYQHSGQEYVHFSICFLTVLPLQMPFCADYYFTVAKC